MDDSCNKSFEGQLTTLEEELIRRYSISKDVENDFISLSPSAIRANTFDICFMKDDRGYIIALSKAYTAHFGVTLEDLEERRYENNFVFDTKPEFLKHDEFVRRTHRTFIGFEEWFNWRTGQIEQGLVIKFAHRCPNNQIGVIGYIPRGAIHVGEAD